MFTVDQLDDLSAINQVSESLLSQMGIQLTNVAKNELGRASASRDINAQTSLAKGIDALQRGTLVEAMAYFQSAASFDPTLTEASKRLSTLSTNLRTGNIGVDARNAIAARNAWIPILRQAEGYYGRHLPIEISYTPRLTQRNLNYQSGTVDLQFSVSSYASDNIRMINDILSGLQKTKKKKEWGFGLWPSQSFGSHIVTTLEVALVNDNGRIISTSKVNLRNDFSFSKSPSALNIIWNSLSFGSTIAGAALVINGVSEYNPDAPEEGTLMTGVFLSVPGGLFSLLGIHFK
jgi:hypothetical protein